MADPAVFIYVDAEGQEQGPCGLEVLVGLPTGTLVRRQGGPLKFKRVEQLPEVSRATRAATAETAGAGDCPAVDGGDAEVEAAWFYEDEAGADRGPLLTAAMLQLVASGLVGGVRNVKKGARGEYRDVALWPELARALEGEAEMVIDPCLPPPAQTSRLSSAVGREAAELVAAEQAEAAKALAEAEAGVVSGEAEAGGWEAEELEWVYRDDSGEVRGPYSTDELREWLSDGLLGPSREVSVAGEEDWRPMREWPELVTAVPAADVAIAEPAAEIAAPAASKGDHDAAATPVAHAAASAAAAPVAPPRSAGATGDAGAGRPPVAGSAAEEDNGGHSGLSDAERARRDLRAATELGVQ